MRGSNGQSGFNSRDRKLGPLVAGQPHMRLLKP